uniref:Uncharacterized protein n=1 Tax=Lutzomyia longipalpis TaxID=7200 RepID=A0A1B0CEJ5_LUTLO
MRILSMLIIIICRIVFVSASSMLPSMSISGEILEIYKPEGSSSCIASYFMCNDSMLCVAQHLNCNEYADCYDGSDEWDCIDQAADSFYDHFYRKNLKALTDDIPWGQCDYSFLEYPDLNSTCKCKMKEVHCQFQGLTTIPPTLPVHGISLLELTGNRFLTLDDIFLENLPPSQKFYLNGNRLTALTSGMLPLLKNLITLSLADNQVRRVSKNALNLPSLEHLFLSGNHLLQIDNETFYLLPNLTGLNLNNNQIEGFQLNAFNGIENLTSL